MKCEVACENSYRSSNMKVLDGPAAYLWALDRSISYADRNSIIGAMAKRRGWVAFLEWSISTAILVFAVISAPSFGLFILPFALIACWRVTHHARMWPEGLGSFGGAGSVLLFVAFINQNSVPCPPSGSNFRVAPGETVSCGGRDPTSWLMIGAALVCVAVIGYSLSRSRRGLT